MLIGLGHDLQLIGELANREDLSSPGAFLTEEESAYVRGSKSPTQTMAGIFSAKEAFFKAAPDARGGFWTDIEIGHDARRAPLIRLHGALRELFERRGWRAMVSISHSGDYVSTMVIIAGDRQSEGDEEQEPR
jgi:holo-[acyl-carrier protein] synthase